MQAREALDFGNAPESAVRRESFCGRLGGACVGVVVGLALFVVSVSLLGWNEFNFVRNEKVIDQVDRDVVEGACTPDPANDGRPVWISCVVQKAYDFHGNAQCPSQIAGEHLKASSAWFEVKSEIYQWVEEHTEKVHKTAGGEKVTERFYTYSKKWVGEPQDSGSFYCVAHWHDREHCPPWAAHEDLENTGSIPDSLRGRKQLAPDYTVSVGGFPRSDEREYHLHRALLSQISATRPAEIDPAAASPIALKSAYDEGGGRVLFANSSERSTVGDVRSTFSLADVRPGITRLSVIALQQKARVGRRFATWSTGRRGTMASVAWLVEGAASKDEMVATRRKSNAAAAMLLRVAGWFAMLLGLQLIAGPLALVPEAIPCVGSCVAGIVGRALCLLNLCISAALSLLIIGTCWLAARPALGLALLCAAGAALAAGACLRRKAARASLVGYPAAVGGSQCGAELQQPLPSAPLAFA